MPPRMTNSPDDAAIQLASDAPSAAIVARGAGSPRVPDDVRLQRLWLAMQRRPWRSLAVLASSNSVDAMWVAELVAKLVWWYRGEQSAVFDFRDLTLRLVDYHLAEVAAQANAQIVVIMYSTFANPTSVPVAHSADAVVLCLELGKTDLKSTQQSIADIGADRVLGSIVLRPSRARSASTG
jgi:hypothetical protein